MATLVPIRLDDGTIIRVQANDAVDDSAAADVPRGGGRVPKGGRLEDSVESLKDTIKGYTRYVLDSFEELGSGNVEKVTLEFGVTVGGSVGIPYITEGTTEGSLKVTVECVWPRD